MAIPPLVLRIYADSSGVKRGVAAAQAQVGGLRASIARNAGLIKSVLGVAVVAGFVKATQAAGDLGEAQNAVNVTFGKSAGIVNRWARAAATSAGLANAEALQAAAGFGAMLDSAGIAGDEAAAMSVKVGQLAADIGSLRNADPTDMLERMRAGLAGEAEPLRRFGVFLSEARVQQEAVRIGLVKTGEELTDAQKIQARYNIILKDSKKAAGDFGRTAGESLPNQLRILRAQLINAAAAVGKVLLPAVIGALKFVNNVAIPGLTKFFQAVGDIASAIMKRLGPALRALEPWVKAAGGFFRVAAEEAQAWYNQLLKVAAGLQGVLDKLAQITNFPTGGINPQAPFSQGGDRFGVDFTPGSQFGGTISGRMPRIVGERGPELIVPASASRVIPNSALGRGGGGRLAIAVSIDRRHWAEQSDYEASYRGF